MKSFGIFLQSGRRILCSVAVFFGLFSTALAQTTWNSASDGVWTNAAAWTAGVPNENTANLISNTASYTVTVDATPATFYGSLNITNAAGRTTRLNVNAPDFTSSNGALTFGRGSEVYVNSGGVMSYTGRTSATPFVTVRDGGVWRLEGGRVDFASLRRATPAGNSQLYVGLDSTGRLEIASGDVVLAGVWESAETNNAVSLRIGQGTAAYGTLAMTGGKLTTWNFDGSSALSVGVGTRSVGVVELSGDALLLASNAVSIGTASSTGSVTLAGNAVFRSRTGMRITVGGESGSLGTVTVRENGLLDWGMLDGLFLGGYGGTGRGVLNIEGGVVKMAGITMNRANGTTGGSAEINLSGGLLGGFGWANGYGITVGRSEAASGGRAQARLNVSGGLLDLSSNMWNSAANRHGLILGSVGTTNIDISVGEMFVSGGTVTNSGQFILGTGFGGTGTVVQTGGNVRQMSAPGWAAYQMTIGWGGGRGSYTLSGGTFVSTQPVYVGGVTASDLGYTPTGSFFTSNSVGTLRIDSGSFAVTNANLYLGRNGSGTLIIGTNGVCTVKDLMLTNNAQSTLRFELGPNGPGTLTASGALTIYPGAKLEVDSRALDIYSTAYRGHDIWIKLVDCATRTTSFAPENIKVSNGVVRQDKNEDIWLFIQQGVVLLVN